MKKPESAEGLETAADILACFLNKHRAHSNYRRARQVVNRQALGMEISEHAIGEIGHVFPLPEKAAAETPKPGEVSAMRLRP